MLERFITTAATSSPAGAASSSATRKRRLHVVEGLLVAQDIIDLVITIIRRSKDPDEARWGLMHVLSAVALRAPERFKDLPRLDLDQARAQMEQLVARARAEEPSYAGLSHRVRGHAASPRSRPSRSSRCACSSLTGIQREELFTELIALTREISRLRDILENESLAARRHQGRAEGGSRDVRRRAAHRDHRRGVASSPART